MADVVDEEQQNSMIAAKLRRTVGLVVVVCLVLIGAIVGGLCGSGNCGRSSSSSDGTVAAAPTNSQPCNLVVTSDVTVVSDTVVRTNLLTVGAFETCIDRETGEPAFDAAICALNFDQQCLEPPHEVWLLFNGGDCQKSDERDDLEYSCQDSSCSVGSGFVTRLVYSLSKNSKSSQANCADEKTGIRFPDCYR